MSQQFWKKSPFLRRDRQHNNQQQHWPHDPVMSSGPPASAIICSAKLHNWGQILTGLERGEGEWLYFVSPSIKGSIFVLLWFVKAASARSKITFTTTQHFRIYLFKNYLFCSIFWGPFVVFYKRTKKGKKSINASAICFFHKINKGQNKLFLKV